MGKAEMLFYALVIALLAVYALVPLSEGLTNGLMVVLVMAFMILSYRTGRSNLILNAGLMLIFLLLYLSRWFAGR